MGCPVSPLVKRPRGFTFLEVPSRRIDGPHMAACLGDGSQIGDAMRHAEYFSEPAKVIHQLLLTVVPWNEFIGVELGKSHNLEG